MPYSPSALSLQVERSSPVVSSARVLQMSGLFDLPPEEKSRVSWTSHLPLDAQDWQIGLIVGPSGAGKSTVACEAFGDAVIGRYDWPTDRSILDAFPSSLGIKEVTGLLTAVGFGSPPNWVRPFGVLSTGEQFRVTVARALAETRTEGLAVIDEFTSVVDRQVAQVASHAIQKTVRRTPGQRLVAVSCHYDIVEWLQPDWVYQPHADEFAWRCLQRRPAVDLSVFGVDRAAWSLFRPYHYLSGDLAKGAHCFGGFINGQCVAFTSYIHFPHPKVRNIKMGHRLVVLPDWQGLGLGGRLDDWLGQHLYAQGYRYHNVVAHPAMLAYYSKSPRWHHLRTGRLSAGARSAKPALKKRQQSFSAQRISSTFCYVPPAVREDRAS